LRTPTALTFLLVTTMAAATAGCGAEPAPGPPAERLLRQAYDRGEVPLADVFGYWRDRNERMARCVEPSGFGYQPYVDRSVIDSRRALGLTREQFTARYGYGITTLIDYVPAGTAVIDPNAIALERLDAVRQTRTAKQLDYCARAVTEEIGPAPFASQDEMDGAQSARTDEILARINGDPRVTAAQSTRTGCITAAGFDPADSRTLRYSDAATAAGDRWSAALHAALTAGRDTTAITLAGVLPAKQSAALAALREEEIAEARQVQPCQFAYDDVYQRVYRETLDAALAGDF
jgi:hypothetical protein